MGQYGVGSIFGGYFHMTSHRQIGHWFAHAATGFAVTDVHGNVVDANEALARIVDRTPAEIGAANLFELTHPEDQARHRSLLDQLLASQLDSAHRPCNFVELLPRLRG